VLLLIADDVAWLDEADAAVLPTGSFPAAALSGKVVLDIGASVTRRATNPRDTHHDPVTGAGHLLGCRGAGSLDELGHRLCQCLGTAGFGQ
jgi:hypothetical protein